MTTRNRKKIPYFEITREERGDDTKGLRGLLTTRDVLATYSDRARTGHNKSSSDKPATKSDRDWMEKCVGGSAPQSQCTPKTPEPTKLQPQKKKRTQFKRGLQFTNSLSRRKSYQEKKSTESNPGGRIDAKEQKPEA